MINLILVECKSTVTQNKTLKEKKRLNNVNFDDLNISGINKVYINENLLFLQIFFLIQRYNEYLALQQILQN